MLREIRSFERDENGEWIAGLSCGHRRHLRHRPPLETHPQVETPEGRAALLGAPLECGRCSRFAPDLHYDAAFYQRETLRDGTAIAIRLLLPADRPRLRIGFAELSAEGRYRRFLAPKTKLSEAELDYLTDVDQHTHVAVGAVALDGDSEGRGLGVARFIALDTPGTAEAAITVIDAVQGQGLGSLLFGHLVCAALERDIRRFRGEVLAANHAMLAITSRFESQQQSTASGVVMVEFELEDQLAANPPLLARPNRQPRALLKLAAEKLASIRRFLSWHSTDDEPPKGE